ncbi:hypothetical protein [Streptomyces sp. NPDC015414]|uniref:hypothetical protein n=1 Tax=Streptomyces sp. NPDC015414 TaxID=3364957 RepID=UPI0036F5860B
MRVHLITKDAAPALGDVRAMGRGDVLALSDDATQRKDWGRYVDGIGQAITNGAEVTQAANWPQRYVPGIDQ